MEQLFQNLICNAIKFRRDNSPVIEISAEMNENKWRFAVKDNGIGIDPVYAKRIFMIFQQLHLKNEYPGTGIGLSVCKKIIERHEGKIWMESRKEGGSVFYFTLPNKQ
jgi:light-regulated signal transduction histidine kinase (bacteriophytochrome)